MSTLPDRAPQALSDEDEEAQQERVWLGGSRRWWLIGGCLIAVASALAIWWGVSATRGISWSPVSVRVAGPHQVDVTFDVVDQNDRPVSCTLVAYDLQHATVGSTTVDLPASNYQSTRYTRSVRTIAAAVTGEVTHCALR